MGQDQVDDAKCGARGEHVTLLIRPQEKDLGGFSVRRLLPAPARQAVGPFIFFDHMGPAQFPPGSGVDVRPHPHIGLATVTYLFEGRIRHRDSLGFVQDIEPGAVNLMVAGSGIVHSERSTEADRATGSRLHGIQMWMALPAELEECAPAFTHHGADALPVVEQSGARVRVIIGTMYGALSPVTVPMETLCCELLLQPGAGLEVPVPPGRELALYVVQGSITAGDCDLQSHTMAVLASGTRLSARGSARCFIIGGVPVGARQLWWNFVASDPARLRQAGERWQSGAFPGVPGEHEFIPLPE
jgi:redox-sensitive bicupin YhaK (pirin superfamily)